MPDLGPSLQVPEPTVLAELVDQVYEAVLCEEVPHLIALRDPRLVNIHVQLPKDYGVLETFHSHLQV